MFCSRRQSISLLTRGTKHAVAYCFRSNSNYQKTFFRHYFVLGGGAISLTAVGLLTYRSFNSFTAHAKSEISASGAVGEGNLEEITATVQEAKEDNTREKRKKVGFRDKKVIEYENRIRAYSTPDKIFRLFATLRVVQENGDSEIFMTPEDFVRAITPDQKQPEGLGLDQFKKVEAKKYKMGNRMDRDSIFNTLGQCGLISFSDFIFLLTVLSATRKHFEIAFRMFDLNGDGDVQYDEFRKVTDVVRAQTQTGKRHRDHSTTGSTLNSEMNSALTTYFFGKSLDQKLTIDKFLDFQHQLQIEILKLEFERYEPKDGRISEKDFAKALLTFAGLSDARKSRMIKRVKKEFKDSQEGVTYESFLNFHKLLKNLCDVETVLSLYQVAGASIDEAMLKHVAKTVVGIELDDHILKVIFTLFDENNDGKLSHKEFILVMKERGMRGLEKPKDTGFARLVDAIIKCAKKTAFVKWENTPT